MDKHLVALGPSSISSTRRLHLITLPHPVNQSTLCTIIENQLYELQSSHLHRNCCWMINQRISSSKNLYFLTKLDLRFLLLPFLEKAGNKYSPLAQIFFNVPGYSSLPIHLLSRAIMEEMCDVNDKLGEDLLLFRYSEEKTMEWLKGKVAKASIMAKTQRIIRIKNQNLAYSSNFNIARPQASLATAAEDQPVTDEDLRIALELVTDSLSLPMAERLCACYGLQAAELLKKSSASLKRKADWEIELEVRDTTAACSICCNTIDFIVSCCMCSKRC
jgi:hypothetical protein